MVDGQGRIRVRAMIKGVLIGFVIMLILAIVPIVHFIGIPFGPFIGGYYGISAATESQGNPGRKALIFGAWTSLLSLIAAAIIIAIVDSVFDPDGNLRIILWGVVIVVPFYYGSMAGLGVWYAELRAKL
ncbi:MAG: hypothetical protein H8E48_06135 [Chloroflexi bacterium]|nr:hypothetical protein [Chloroflexota bacterium]